MDERCQRFHSKLVSGTCPWCGRAIVDGQVEDVFGQVADFVAILRDVNDFTAGRSLFTLVSQNGRLEYPIAVGYIRAVAIQLASIQDAGGYHGRVFPAAIFLNEEGAIRLGVNGRTFFSEEPPEGIVDEHAALQFADYLAPEQVSHSSGPDPRSDIYSLGCTLYFLLVGTPPFPKGTISERLLKHQTETPVPIDEVRTDVPKELVQICAKMLAKKPSDRYQNATELVSDLSQIQ